MTDNPKIEETWPIKAIHSKQDLFIENPEMFNVSFLNMQKNILYGKMRFYNHTKKVKEFSFKMDVNEREDVEVTLKFLTSVAEHAKAMREAIIKAVMPAPTSPE